MPASRQPPDPIQNLLQEAETELSRRLREACDAEARGVPTDSAEEIRRLEDTLLSAAMAAQRLGAARRHLGDKSPEAGGQSSETAAVGDRGAPGSRADMASDPDTTGDRDSSLSTTVREFEDSTGRTWRAWPVTPGTARARESSRQFLGSFQEGWICFEALDNSGRRRLPRREPRWSELAPRELQRLLDEAIDAPSRKARRPNLQSGPEAGGASLDPD